MRVDYGVITGERLREYAEASGDPNPIHLEDKAAREHGLPGRIAHGMLSAGFIASTAEKWQASQATETKRRLFRLTTRFKAMVFLGDHIVVDCQVVPTSDPLVVQLELQVKNQKEETVSAGTALYR